MINLLAAEDLGICSDAQKPIKSETFEKVTPAGITDCQLIVVKQYTVKEYFAIKYPMTWGPMRLDVHVLNKSTITHLFLQLLAFAVYFKRTSAISAYYLSI